LVLGKSKSQQILVLSGGWGELWENEHSRVYAQTVSEILGGAGYETNILDCRRPQDFLAHVSDHVIAYNCLFGRYGEDGIVAAVLEFLQISYTGSGPTAGALAMDKALSGALVASRGVHCPRTLLLRREQLAALNEPALVSMLEDVGLSLEHSDSASHPVLITKPNRSSFSSGVRTIHRNDELRVALNHSAQFDESVLVQEFVEGTTVYVPVLCGVALTPVEVVPADTSCKLHGLSFRSKRHTYLVPARLDNDVSTRLCRTAEKVHITLGCRGLTRSDFRVNSDDALFLELNAQHSVRPQSVALMSARYSGLSALELVESILNDRWLPSHSAQLA
jgi:D-alanine-D-alanine ligase